VLGGVGSIAPTFDIDAMRKDLRTMLDEGQAHGIPLPVAAQTLRALDEASAAGLGASDRAYMPATG
jgi:3-hydroxyisobutyrate dehydrogenase